MLFYPSPINSCLRRSGRRRNTLVVPREVLGVGGLSPGYHHIQRQSITPKCPPHSPGAQGWTKAATARQHAHKSIAPLPGTFPSTQVPPAG